MAQTLPILSWIEVAVVLIIALCSSVDAQEPFVSYNKTVPIGDSGYVKWDLNSFGSPVNLWLQQLAPNASAPQVPLDYTNTKGFFLWSAGTNLKPGQYFYQLQSVGGSGIIFKSNPIMVVCSECPVENYDATATTLDDTSSETLSTPPQGLTGGSSSEKGFHLTPGVAAGIGAGGSLLLVAIVLGLIYLLMRRRKRKQSWNVSRPSMTTSTHSPSFTLTSPASHSLSVYDPFQQKHTGFTYGSAMAVTQDPGGRRIPSHELDSMGMAKSPSIHVDRPGSKHTVSGQPSQPNSGSIITPPQYNSPPLSSTRPDFQHHHLSHTGGLSPTSGHRASSNSHERGSYGFPSQATSLNAEAEGNQFRESSPPNGGSYDSQQYLIPRRVIGSLNLRNEEQSQ